MLCFAALLMLLPYSTPTPLVNSLLPLIFSLPLLILNAGLSLPHFTSPLGESVLTDWVIFASTFMLIQTPHTAHILLSAVFLFLFLFLTKKKMGHTKVSSLQHSFCYMNFNITFKTEFQ